MNIFSFNMAQLVYLPKKTELCQIMEKYGSDKGGGIEWHNYTRFYYDIFFPFRDEIKTVFELGLGTNNTDVKSSMGPDGKPGASLRGWREFFPKADIYGADIDKRILFQEDRIKTYYCDQTDPKTISELYDGLNNTTFDIIIEDGLHEFEANKTFFENSINKLSLKGTYIIEDIQNSEVQKFIDIFPIWERIFNVKCSLIMLSHRRNNHDNNLCVITRSS